MIVLRNNNDFSVDFSFFDKKSMENMEKVLDEYGIFHKMRLVKGTQLWKIPQ